MVLHMLWRPHISHSTTVNDGREHRRIKAQPGVERAEEEMRKLCGEADRKEGRQVTRDVSIDEERHIMENHRKQEGEEVEGRKKRERVRGRN